MAELRKANITGITKNDINSPEPYVELSLDQIIVRAMGGIEGKNVIAFLKHQKKSYKPSGVLTIIRLIFCVLAIEQPIRILYEIYTVM